MRPEVSRSDEMAENSEDPQQNGDFSSVEEDSTSRGVKPERKRKRNVPQTNSTTRQNELPVINDLKDSLAKLGSMVKEFMQASTSGNATQTIRPKSGSSRRRKRSGKQTSSSSNNSSESSSSDDSSEHSDSKRSRKSSSSSSSSYLSRNTGQEEIPTARGGEGTVGLGLREENKDGGEFLDDLNQEVNEKDEEVDHPVCEKLANIVDKRWKKLIPNEKLKKLHASYRRPSNCSQLIVPRVNRPVWMRMRREQKDSDRRIALYKKMSLLPQMH